MLAVKQIFTFILHLVKILTATEIVLDFGMCAIYFLFLLIHEYMTQLIYWQKGVG